MKQCFEKVSLKQFMNDWIDTFENQPDHIITEIYNNIKLPRRKTKLSAGYDIASTLQTLKYICFVSSSTPSLQNINGSFFFDKNTGNLYM